MSEQEINRELDLAMAELDAEVREQDQTMMSYNRLADTITALRERVVELEGVVDDVETDLTHALITHFDYDLPAQLVSELEHAKGKLRKAALAASNLAGGEGE